MKGETMTRARIVGFCVAAALATSALSAASASAAPEFLHTALPLTLTAFTGKSVGAVTIADPIANSVTKCSKEEIEGEIESGSTTHVEEVVIKFKGCTGEVFKGTKVVKKCSVKSTGQAPGTVKTKRLDGDLGEVLPAEALDEVGLDLKPEVGTTITVVEAPACALPNAKVEGSIIGEVTPKNGPETLEKKLVSTTVAGAQKIQKFVAGLKDTAEVAATEVTLTSTVNLKFLEVLVVT
jgi:hypothetical protein